MRGNGATEGDDHLGLCWENCREWKKVVESSVMTGRGRVQQRKADWRESGEQGRNQQLWNPEAR